MNKRVIFLMAILVFACGKNDEHTAGSGVLSKDQMVHVLIDLYVTEQKIELIKLKGDSGRKIFERLDSGIFVKAGFTSEQFQESYNYYVDRPKEFELLYTALVDSLSLREQRLSVPK